LTLQPSLGSADLSAIFYGKPKEEDGDGESRPTTTMMKERKHTLQVSTYQMVILMLFNTKESWSLEVEYSFKLFIDKDFALYMIDEEVHLLYSNMSNSHKQLG
jgi:hypothetical protein